ncbi:MAG: SAM-dependent chlorinase/fluorinase [candidate division Zixibacteria bacterium]|nr:SAM-dependent chlorinase/fluorinase [candidate division Zixibacteria bacterium]
MATLALLTDFGDRDVFVGMMKAVIHKIAPACNIIDITHNIDSFNIKAAAFVLQKSVEYYPDDTVFVAVVDPDVGSDRRIIAAEAGSYRFVAPDNGVLSYVLAGLESRHVVSVENQKYFLSQVSRTFHGRDIMAPVATHLASGVALSDMGPSVNAYQVIPFPNLLKYSRSVIGEVMYVDKFGNLISNITRKDLPLGVELSQLRVTIGDTKHIKFTDHYAAGDGLSAIISGFGTVEVFVNRGSAASQFAQPLGATIVVEA